MSVLLETSLGDIVIDLEIEACPITCANFLKLCKVYYYNLNAFFNVSKDFLAQTGDPTATGTGGECAASYFASKNGSKSTVARYFAPELVPRLKHTMKGTVSMAVARTAGGGSGGCGSQFFITLADSIDYLDGQHAVFGHVVEGLETLDALNDVFTDESGRPLKDVRIRHVEVLEDPFPDPEGLVVPEDLPTRPPDAEGDFARILEDEDPLAELPEEEAEEERRRKAAVASALTLEMVGDLPFANVRPPENVLFVCKLNSVTRDEDLELIFSRFGKIMSCQVIRDKKTGDSLQYAFIEFDRKEDAEQAYFKMQNVLVDDRRIWVDFQLLNSTEDGQTTQPEVEREVVGVSEVDRTSKPGRATETGEAEVVVDGMTVMGWCSTPMTTPHLDESGERGVGQHRQGIETTDGINVTDEARTAGDTTVTTTGEACAVRGAATARQIGVIRVDNDS
ncbi:Peptidyl-prolyl cis-trans isomerase cyp6 [Tulasnella sp. 427]|nr:Peptidyl-prolyl cis-trans isomerase cyp6 [Tulasnella sp. 427]